MTKISIHLFLLLLLTGVVVPETGFSQCRDISLAALRREPSHAVIQQNRFLNQFVLFKDGQETKFKIDHTMEILSFDDVKSFGKYTPYEEDNTCIYDAVIIHLGLSLDDINNPRIVYIYEQAKYKLLKIDNQGMGSFDLIPSGKKRIKNGGTLEDCSDGDFTMLTENYQKYINVYRRPNGPRKKLFIAPDNGDSDPTSISFPVNELYQIIEQHAEEIARVISRKPAQKHITVKREDVGIILWSAAPNFIPATRPYCKHQIILVPSYISPVPTTPGQLTGYYANYGSMCPPKCPSSINKVVYKMNPLPASPLRRKK